MTRKILILRVVRALILAGLALGVGGADVACSSSSKPTCGGVVIEGKCMQKCTDSACVAGTRCLDDKTLNDQCSRKCTTQNDCAVGTNCVNWTFPDGSKGHYCARLPYTKGGNTGEYVPCTANSECDALRGFQCIGGKCQVPCTTSADCSSIGVCGPGGTNAKGKDVCIRDNKPRGPGEFGSACPNGVDSDCSTQNDFVCIGLPGATDGYCSRADCTSDSDCPQDYFCALLSSRTPRSTPPTPCQTACGGIPGNSSDPNCVPASDIGPGKKYQCGHEGLVRHYCIKRSFCNSCTSDADCLAYPGQVCASDGNGHKYCTVRCDPSTNSCPWGSAATCGVWDKSLGFPTCRHRFGACTGTGKACEPCIDDTNCPNGFCDMSDAFTGEHFCVNLKDTCSCPVGSTSRETPFCNGGGCPETPGKLQGSCYGDSSLSGTGIYDHCLGADINQGLLGGTPQTGCWPHN